MLLEGLKHVSVIHGSTKYFMSQQQCKGNQLLHFHGNSGNLNMQMVVYLLVQSNAETVNIDGSAIRIWGMA
jgi:hypothetical protein